MQRTLLFLRKCQNVAVGCEKWAMKAKELLSRYRRGERIFRGVDLSGESLRGMSLTGVDLSEANLSKTDLRGAKFTDATLIGTQFCEAKAGTRRRWVVPIVLFSLVLSFLAALLLGIFVAAFVVAIVESGQNVFELGNETAGIVAGLLGIGAITLTFYFDYHRGILATLSAFVGAFAVAAAGAFAFAVAGAFAGVGAFAGAFVFAGAIATAFAVTFAVAGAFAFAVAGAFAVAVAGAFAIAGAFAVAVAQNSSITPLIVAITVIIVLSLTILNFIISRRALSGDPRDQLIRDLAVGLTSFGGTSFRNADLTDANFSHATVKSAHFKAANLTRTCFHLSQKLHLSRAYKTPLANRTALNLLVSLRPEPNKSYIGLNLKGANLSYAELADLDLTEADLSDATLAGADLQRANLSKLQALGTNFHQANLTAACLESWNIDSTTRLQGAICEHVYLLRNQQERRPNSGTFAPGEFAKLFEEVLNTIDLIFRDGIDWRAFMQTFQTIQVEHEGANLEIQSMENKGDGVMVVRLNTSLGADKPAIHQAFKQEYEMKLAAVEQEYKALLQSKDQAIEQKEEIIELHRQQSTDMMRLAESLAQRPVTVDVKATANSQSTQENDESQTIDIDGNVENAVVNLGDGGEVNHQAGSKE